MRSAIAAGPDWGAVVEGATRHRVAPFLLHALEACASEAVPPDVIASLRQQMVRSARRALLHVAETERLVHAFDKAGVRVLVLKGEVLSKQIYDNPALRGARDIDFLADPERFAEAEAVLTAAGYHSRSKDTSPGRRAVYRQFIKEVEYVHPGHKTLVELHHRLIDNPSLLPSDFDTLWSERAEVQLAQCAVPTLPRSHLALYLCAHGANHSWQRLRWLADFAGELKLSGNVDATLAAARAGGLEAATLHALRLSHDWLGLPLSERHLATASENKHARRLDRIFTRISGDERWMQPLPSRGFAAARTRIYVFMLKADPRYWANQVRRAWFTPDDWDLVRLPDPLLWLRHFVRPFGWILRRKPWPSLQRGGRVRLIRQR